MAVTIHLGVVEVPYSGPAETKPGSKVANGGQTTGDVAEWLEDKYHVMEHFLQAREGKVAAALENSVARAIESVMLGAPADTLDAFGSATSAIEQEFRAFLASKEIENLGYPGVPTKAALRGVNHRLKLRRGPRRPSFVDTGLYEADFKSWAE